jgi:uncharacterized membrane protein YfcA
MGTYLTYLVAGLAAGFTSALLGIGGGVVMVPILVLLFGLEARTATATSLAYIVPVAAVGVVLAMWHGDAPRWRLVLMAAPMGFIGAYLGRWTSSHISGAHVKLLFAVLMIVVGVRLGLNGLHSLRQPSERPSASTPIDAPPTAGA